MFSSLSYTSELTGALVASSGELLTLLELGLSAGLGVSLKFLSGIELEL